MHGLNIPDCYAILLFTALDLTSIISHIHSWVLFLLWLHLLILSGAISPPISPVVFWALIDLGSSPFSVLAFCLFILLIGFSRKNTEVVCLWIHGYLFIVASYFSIVNSSILSLNSVECNRPSEGLPLSTTTFSHKIM